MRGYTSVSFLHPRRWCPKSSGPAPHVSVLSGCRCYNGSLPPGILRDRRRPPLFQKNVKCIVHPLSRCTEHAPPLCSWGIAVAWYLPGPQQNTLSSYSKKQGLSVQNLHSLKFLLNSIIGNRKSKIENHIAPSSRASILQMIWLSSYQFNSMALAGHSHAQMPHP